MTNDSPQRQPTDAELVAACRQGRTEAFGELVGRYQDRVYNLAWRLTGHAEEAADVAQESFLKAYRALDDYRGDAAFYTWMFRITVNEARSRHRFRAVRPAEVSLEGKGAAHSERQGAPLSEQLQARVPDPSDQACSAEDRRTVEAALRMLDVEHRTIVVMRDIEGRDYAEIAELLGCPRGTVKSRLHRARMALKELLGPMLGMTGEG